MNGSDILDYYRQELGKALCEGGGATSELNPLTISPWLAMSLMQKAIRRGREDFALRAAAKLLQDSPARLWRRLCITAYEDIGVADFETVAVVTAAPG
jgi:hypothetical protein